MIASCAGRMPNRWYQWGSKHVRYVASGWNSRPKYRAAIEQRPRRIRSDKR